MDFSAVIFDMDGLMLDTERLASQVVKESAAHHGWTVSDELCLALVGRNEVDCREILIEALGPSYPIDEIHQSYIEVYERHLLEKGAPLKAGLLPLLDLLEERAIPRAVATSTSRELALLKLGVTGLLDRFPFIVCGDEITCGKPAPDIFLAAARKMGREPGKCLVLEDSEPGIRAAVSAGMTAILVPDLCLPSDEVRGLASLVCGSLNEVRSRLEKVLSSGRF